MLVKYPAANSGEADPKKFNMNSPAESAFCWAWLY